MQVSRRHIIWFVVGLGVISLIVMAFLPKPLAVDFGRVTRQPLRITIDAEGKTRVRHRSIVSAPVTGRLARIALTEGDHVNQGEVVARIDPLPLESAVQEAQARIAEWRAQRAGVETLRPKPQSLSHLEARIAAAQSANRESEARVGQAEAAYAQAQREVQRAQRLEAVGAMAREEREVLDLTTVTRRKELEAARLEVERTAAEVRAARAEFAALQAEQQDPDYLIEVYSARIASIEAELARLRDEAQRTEILAPVSGQVLRILEEHERSVVAGTPLVEIGDLTQLEVVIDVLSTDSVKIRPGAQVLIEQWGGEASLLAQVQLVEPSAFTKISALGVEEQRVNVIAVFTTSPVPLGDGYRVEARIVVWEGEGVLSVPLSALFRCDDDWCIFTVATDRAKRQVVKLGHRNRTAAEVLSGVEEGELVVLHPGDQLQDNTRVEQR